MARDLYSSANNLAIRRKSYLKYRAVAEQGFPAKDFEHGFIPTRDWERISPEKGL
jgi:hypothetical protein